MKKRQLFTLLVFVIISLTGCSSITDNDEIVNPNIPVDQPLLSKVTKITPTDSLTMSYAYDGYRLKSVTWSTGYIEVYIYDGNRIQKKEGYKNNILADTKTYNYTADKLSSIVEQEHSGQWKTIVTQFSYNTNGQIGYVQTYSRLIYGQMTLETTYTGNIFLTDSNVSKVEYTVSYGNVSKSGFTSYSYDSSNNPFKNIVGFENLIQVAANSAAIYSGNNIAVSKNSEITDYGKVTYDYNSKNFPVKSVRSVHDGNNQPTGVTVVNIFEYK
jgi:hypothetical protein